jgi:hypothetical protein
MDKLILVLYVDVTNIEQADVERHVRYIGNLLFNEDVIKKLDATTFVIPRLGGGTTIECINPKFVVDKEVNKSYESKMKILNDNLEHFIDLKKDGK